MSRTGTMSLYVALKELGYACYHMVKCSLDNSNNSLGNWNQAIEAKYHGKGRAFQGSADFDRMLWRYDAVTDIPCILFAEELIDAYPNAQIILTNRNIDTWAISVERSFMSILTMKRWKLLERLDTVWTRPYIKLLTSALDIWTDGNWKDRSRLMASFKDHYEHVREAAQARGRPVLEYRVHEGWGPLCKFLGKEQPDRPFPKVNQGDWTAQYHVVVFWWVFLTKVWWVLVSFGLSLVVVLVAWWVRSSE
ncbi:NAD dependent epimerase/dehydratase [Aspergillus sclerotioniger CBS 115572]|uniref:NAD dependent epimerase/dehydratase n=1 Tax=Aspergillus sclerotioniger CBS 115572 TaxID=1450535 RepID=A0A317X9X9_9EURO|nr:NAD dependent epimerase/dehydratase [Aspergillus sclerotioniger CBS 115572]PWY95396.1 NAD dependent epimerase/dehydratase [Aspergillus sclerotioniger CBS 115572]